ncbi:MAG TPA: rhomboid family intramembrane serine protease [Burkholderiaceae bacterium]|nr:rhomboid family intramembrane serine protease [Burkholderiaceae bacterium]
MQTLSALAGDTPGALLLLAVILVAGLVGLFASPTLIARSLFRPYWLVRNNEWATLATNGFVHADLPHLIFNAFTFWAFALSLEAAMGTPRFLALYAFGLLVGDLGTYIRHRGDPDYRTLGASGAILAVLFAAIVYTPTSSIFILPIPVPIPAPLFALGYLAYTYYASRQLRGHVNHDAHLGGALAGLGFVALTDWAAVERAWRIVAA